MGTLVIPGRAQRVRPEVAGPMAGSGAKPESIITKSGVPDSSAIPGAVGVMDSGLATSWRPGMTGCCAPRPCRAHHCRPFEQGVRMADDVPFDKSFDLEPDRVKEVAPLVRAVAANNPSPFTFKGTVSYIIGRGKVAILDPGPDDDAHVAALLDAVRGETVSHIFVTHTHRDHSPAVPKVKAATGAIVYAQGPHRLARPLHIGETRRLDASADMDFRPDVALADGEVVSGDGWRLEAVTTAGHTANHMAFAFPESDLIFSGDHVMGWSTIIVAPPDGAMSDYINSLHKLAKSSQPVSLPG